MQPAAIPVQEGIGERDVGCAVAGSQVLDAGGCVFKISRPEALPEHPFATERTLVRAASGKMKRQRAIVVDLVLVDCHLVEARRGQTLHRQQRPRRVDKLTGTRIEILRTSDAFYVDPALRIKFRVKSA